MFRAEVREAFQELKGSGPRNWHGGLISSTAGASPLIMFRAGRTATNLVGRPHFIQGVVDILPRADEREASPLVDDAAGQGWGLDEDKGEFERICV